VAGCTSLDGPGNQRADRQFRREDARLVALEEYELLKDACNKAGGFVIVRNTQPRFAIRTSDMRMATCGGRSAIGQ
jgi:hypothetical protein